MKLQTMATYVLELGVERLLSRMKIVINVQGLLA